MFYYCCISIDKIINIAGLINHINLLTVFRIKIVHIVILCEKYKFDLVQAQHKNNLGKRSVNKGKKNNRKEKT